jgi:hypothetical protein
MKKRKWNRDMNIGGKKNFEKLNSSLSTHDMFSSSVAIHTTLFTLLSILRGSVQLLVFLFQLDFCE